jgi:L-ascorbate metabolism protein UlaG (beta-lactamase superfamily)
MQENKFSYLFLFTLILSLNHCFLFRSIDKPTQSIHLKDIDQSQVKIHWIGHATVLLQIYDKWILTDPNFSDQIGLIVKRYIYTPTEISELPEIDAVLISHTHFDHLDQPTLKQLKIKGNLFVPDGGGFYIPNIHEDKKVEMKPWDNHESNQVKVTAVPARHFGGRWLIDNLWDGDPYTGYVIEYKDVTIYFAGDTGYQKEQFIEIGKKFNIDVALLPVGPSKGPNNPVHINPFEAVDTFLDLRAKYLIPMHYGTFYRSMESELPTLLQALQPLEKKALILSIGDTYEFKK